MNKTGLNDNFLNTELDIEMFKKMVEIHDHITLLLVDRSDLNNVSYSLEKKEDGAYDLKIAKDITNIELYNLSKALEKDLGLEYFGSIEYFQDKVKILIGALIKDGNLTIKEVKQLLEENNIEVDESLFTQEVNISKEDFSDAIKQIKIFQKERYWERGKTKSLKSLNEEDWKNLISKMLQQLLGTEIHNRGKDQFIGVNVLTQSEVKRLYEEYGPNDERVYLKKFLDENGNLDGKLFHNLEKEEKSIEEKVGIEQLKKDLNEVRKIENNEKNIEELELKATNKIIEELYNNFIRINIDKETNYSMKYSKETKRLKCTLFSTLGSSLLDKLNIKHKGISIKEHTVLEINIGNKKYFFDSTGNNKIYEFKYGDYIQDTNLEGNILKGVDREILFLNGPLFKNKIYGSSGNSEFILQSHILNNFLNDIHIKKDLSMEYLIKAIQLEPKNSVLYSTLGSWLSSTNLYQSIKCYKIAIMLNPKDENSYFGLGKTLELNEQYKDSTIYYKKVLELNPKRLETYGKISNNLLILGKRLQVIYRFINALLKGKEVSLEYLKNNGFEKEGKIILELIEKQDYEGLKNYALKLLAEEGF